MGFYFFGPFCSSFWKTKCPLFVHILENETTTPTSKERVFCFPKRVTFFLHFFLVIYILVGAFHFLKHLLFVSIFISHDTWWVSIRYQGGQKRTNETMTKLYAE
jgi:hypothetical protein